MKWTPTWENLSTEFSTRSSTKQAVQTQKLARGLKFLTKEVEGMHYPCSENKGTAQQRGYREADSTSLFTHKQKADFLKMRIKW